MSTNGRHDTLPCPICGWETSQLLTRLSNPSEWWSVCCRRTCQTCGPVRSTPGEAELAWNQRATPAPRVFITVNDDRTIGRVYRTREGAIHGVVTEMHRSRGGSDAVPIADWDREQLKRLAESQISEEEVVL